MASTDRPIVTSRRRRITPSNGHDIIVAGTSAGGLEALDALIGQLPTDLAATMFVVQHMAPANSGEALVRRLGRHKAFGAALAVEGQRFKRGRIYIAPPDNRIRAMLLSPQSEGFEDQLTAVKGLMAEPRKARSAR